MTDDPKPTITPEEMQRRRVHVRVAIADDRIEGIDGPGTDEQAVLDAYIRGEIEARDLVTAYRRARGEAMTETDADPIRAYPELVTAIAIRAFAEAKDAAIRENDRLGIPSYGSKDGKIVVRHPPQAKTPTDI